MWAEDICNDGDTLERRRVLETPDFQLLVRAEEPCDCDSSMRRCDCCHKRCACKGTCHRLQEHL